MYCSMLHWGRLIDGLHNSPNAAHCYWVQVSDVQQRNQSSIYMLLKMHVSSLRICREVCGGLVWPDWSVPWQRCWLSIISSGRWDYMSPLCRANCFTKNCLGCSCIWLDPAWLPYPSLEWYLGYIGLKTDPTSDRYTCQSGASGDSTSPYQTNTKFHHKDL